MELGSPPQVRGKLYNSVDNIFRYRITPAGAGKTLEDFSDSFADKDHPRRCGENSVCCTEVHLRIGSPPQVRGKPDEVTAYQAATRITPAGAGKTVFRNAHG